MEKDKSAFMLLLRDINAICNNRINIAEKDCRPENNFFLQKCFYNKIFREQSLRKIERLYSKYKNNDKEINYAIELIKGLFSKNWTGSYSELCAYDLINLCFENPCNIQLTNKEKIKTLAKFYKNRKGTTTVDGYISDILTFFEVKSLSNNTLEQINKLKNEVNQNNLDITQQQTINNIEENLTKNGNENSSVLTGSEEIDSSYELEQNSSDKFTSLSFWITVICLVIGFVQSLCFVFGVNLQTNIIIDVCAFALSLLVCFGVLKVKSRKVSKNDIKQAMKDKLDNDK